MPPAQSGLSLGKNNLPGEAVPDTAGWGFSRNADEWNKAAFAADVFRTSPRYMLNLLFCPISAASGQAARPRTPCTPLTVMPPALTLAPMFTLLTYIALIVGVNYAFAVTPLVELPNGEMWPPLSLVVGFIFVVRDYAQRRVGHKVLWAMLVGCVVSWYMATPQLALASAAAFAIGELGDWALYTFTNRPFSQRILISSLVGAPLDSIVFLLIIGLATPWSIITMSASKLLGALLVFWLVRRREQREYAMGVQA